MQRDQAKRLREALHVYAVVEDALRENPPSEKDWVPGPELARHLCSARVCRFVKATDDIFVCLFSCHMHRCTADTCKHLEPTPDGLVCPISGYSFESQPMLGIETFVAMGKQQVTNELPFDTCGGVEAGRVERAHENPFDSARERQLARKQREHAARERDCHALLDLLLFSEHRKGLHKWAHEHTLEKHDKNVGNYMRSADTKRVMYEHVVRIINLDRLETMWAIEMPKPESYAHKECRRICEQACVWWNRFAEQNKPRTPSNYIFRYHVLAVLYIYAKGLEIDGREVLAPSHVLMHTLPGVDTLKTFPTLLPGYYTAHERECRDQMYTWLSNR